MKKAYLLATLLALPIVVAAQGIPNPPITLPSGQATGINDPQTITNVFCVVLNYMFFALIAAAIFFVVLAAFRYLTSAGDPEKVKAASRMLIFAAVAIAVGILAQAIPIIVGSFLGVGQGFSVC